MRESVDTLWQTLQTRFYLRWTLANMIGWSGGMILGSLGLALIGGIPGVFLAGGLMGAVAGTMQWVAMPELSRRWMLWSAVGGTIAALPVFLAAFALIAGRGVGLAVMGAVYGLCIGWIQTLALRGDGTFVWVIINVVAGGLCGMLTLLPVSVPVCLSPGPMIFGLLTGWVLYTLQDELF